MTPTGKITGAAAFEYAKNGKMTMPFFLLTSDRNPHQNFHLIELTTMEITSLETLDGLQRKNKMTIDAETEDRTGAP